MYHKGKFTDIKHPEKYVGDITKIIYRSHWERNVMRWLDGNESVAEWASEEIAIPYEHPIYQRRQKYYPDFYVKFIDGTVKVIEVKPEIQTKKPITPKTKNKTSRYVNEMITYTINMTKWAKATEVSQRNNFIFEIWTEKTLKEMGILNWETDKIKLLKESTKSKKPKFVNIFKSAKIKKPRPKRRS
tara:strand:- start:3308 stop:3868 length:561 start_codon:yes stop_codon:yes gene_type:complete